MSVPKETRLEGWKRILSIAWPLIIANSFWNLQLTIDRIFLGQYSTDSLAAALAVMGVFWTPMALVQQTAAYSMTFVAQYFGAKQNKDIGPAVWHALYLAIAGGILMLGLIPMAPWLFQAIGHSEKLQPLEIQYFEALCHSALPAAITAAVSGFFTGLSRSQAVMWINAVGLVANVIFDYIMIFGKFGFPEMGIAGAGYATALANWASALFGIAWILRLDRSGEYGFVKGWRLKLDLVRRYIRYGVPSGLQWALEGLAFTVFLIFLGRMKSGDAALAASGIVVTVMMLAVLPAMGVAQAVSVQVGQHLGEQKPELAVRDTWRGFQVALMYILSIGVTLILFPGFYLSWFKNDADPALWGQVTVMVPYLLMFVAFFTAFDSMNFVFSFALKGAGDTRFVTMVALLLPWPVMVLPTALLSHVPGGLYYSWGAASLYGCLLAFVFWARFRGGKWKSMSVIR